MYAGNQCFFYIGCTAGAGCKSYKRWDITVIFFFYLLKSVLYIIHQLVSIGNANMNRGIYTNRAATLLPVRATKNSQPVIEASQPGRLMVLLNWAFHLSVLQYIFVHCLSSISLRNCSCMSFSSIQKANLPCRLVNSCANTTSSVSAGG